MITFMGHHIPTDGYGYATTQIAEALRARDPSVKIIDMCPAPDEFAPFDEEWHVDADADVVALCTPDWLPCIKGAQRIINYTMFEASILPAGWVELINLYASGCLVPSEWCRQVFVENGVRVPVAVAKWGINPAHYFPLERADHDGPYTFMWSGTSDPRKGWDVAYRAFMAAFGRRRDVRLHMHFRTPLRGNLPFADPNVTVTIGVVERQMQRAMLRGADCYVFPSRGEGWGSPPREAAATGLAVIATNAGGLAEELEGWGIPLRTKGMSRAAYGFWPEGDIGEWFEPDVEHLATQMSWCFENRALAAKRGELAAKWLVKNATWDRTARRLLEIGGDYENSFRRSDGQEAVAGGVGVVA